MNKPILSAISLAVVLGLSACSKPATQTDSATADSAVSVKHDNVLMQTFSGPYEGVPAFDKMDLALLAPAVEKGMEINLAEIEAIANNPEAPTFANTFEALERAGKELDNVFSYWGIWASNMSSPEFRQIQRELSPKLSDFRSRFLKTKRYLLRLKRSMKALNLTPLT